MGLNNFFSINFPYGIQRNSNGEWTAFNREYKPLGFNDSFSVVNFEDYPVYTKYSNLSIKTIALLTNEDESNIFLNKDGDIDKIFFYSDNTNPANNPKYWNDYFEIIKELSKLKRK